MEELTFNDQIVLFDKKATIAAYQTIEHGDADGCTCGGCRNFRQFRSHAYGTRLLALLELLGIDPLKEWEVWSCGVEINERIEYGGWFAFVGEWSPKNIVKSAGDFAKQPEFFFTDSFPNAAEKFGPKTLAVGFNIAVPKASDYVSDWE